MRICCLLATLLLLTGTPALADTVALSGFTGGTAYQSVYGQSNTIGWTFQPTVNLTVTQLGLYDPASYGLPLTASHPVGLWDSSGDLLASAPVAPIGTEMDGFYFTAITPVSLLAGDTYTLGALFTSITDDYITSTATRTTDPAITYGEGLYVNSLTLTEPTLGGPTVDGRFGPNFQFTAAPTPQPSTAPTPEPSSLWLLGSGLLAAAGVARFRRRQACSQPGSGLDSNG